jgi:ferrous iron transport protein B
MTASLPSLSSHQAKTGALHPAKPAVRVVALVGNPNTGKTTLFNALSGLNQRVGNYPGVTVEKKVGIVRLGEQTLHLIDLPGTYSLAARSPDEMVTVDLLLGQQLGAEKPDLILNIVDASNLERNLFLTTQLADLGIPLVVAVNMTDAAAKKGIQIDYEGLSKELGMPLVPIAAHQKRGLPQLQRLLVETRADTHEKPDFPPSFQQEVQRLKQWLMEHDAAPQEIQTALLARLLIDVQGEMEKRYLRRFGDALGREVQISRDLLKAAGHPVPQVEARTRYAFLRKKVSPFVRRQASASNDWTTRIDRVITHRFWGLLLFLGLLFIIFQSIFSWAEPLKKLLENGIGWLGNLLAGGLAEGPLKSLIVDGVIGGVGSVVTFLPQIMILFAFLAILEDCGYMARAAFLMDKIMSRCGLSGKSFIPLLSSFACAIPGVMATRVIEDRRDRLATILVAPLMSCSARLPIYTLMIGAFIPTSTALGTHLQGLVLFAMYLIGIVIAPLVAWVLKRTILRGETPIFVLELPPYKLPTLRGVVQRMFERGWAFLRRAGTFILASMIVMWALLYFPRTDAQGRQYDTRIAELQESLMQERTKEQPEAAKVDVLEGHLAQLQGEWKRQSYLGRLGKALEPAFQPLGWDWRIGTAALASFPAREVIVGVLGLLFDLGKVDEEKTEPLTQQLQNATWEDGSGRKLFSLATALSIMVFFALCCQCASTLAVIRRETNSWFWPAFTFIYMTVLAYVAAWATYQAGTYLGA